MKAIKLFFTSFEAADLVPIGVRQFNRCAQDLGIKLSSSNRRLGGAKTHYRYTMKDIETVRSRLKRKRAQ